MKSPGQFLENACNLVAKVDALVVQGVEHAAAGAEIGQRALQVFGRFAQRASRVLALFHASGDVDRVIADFFHFAVDRLIALAQVVNGRRNGRASPVTK